MAVGIKHINDYKLAHRYLGAAERPENPYKC